MFKYVINGKILCNLLRTFKYSNSKLCFSIVNDKMSKHCVLKTVFNKAVSSINPPHLVGKELRVEGNKLNIRGNEYELNCNCYIIGFGKCVFSMAYKIEEILGKNLKSGIISIPEGFLNSSTSKHEDESNLYHLKDLLNIKSNSCIKVFEGAKNNLPDEKAMLAALHIKSLAESLNKDDILFVVISGGGSALLPLPIPPITLSEKKEVIKLLVSAGADIMELNSVRKRLSVLKGGGLSSLAHPASVITLILSDVIGDPLGSIASGPTVFNTDPVDLPLNILKKYSLIDEIPKSVISVLQQDAIKKTENKCVQNILLGNNEIALTHALDEANLKGYNAVILSSSVEGLVSEVCDMYISLVVIIHRAFLGHISETEAIQNLEVSLKNFKVPDKFIQQKINDILTFRNKKLFLLFGGETTVKITGLGLGGRNQELALRFSIKLHNLEEYYPSINKFKISFLSAGTDGIDGPTNAAGAIAYSGQIKQAVEQNLISESYVKNNDSFHFFQTLNNGSDVITIGHTGVNVMDLQFLCIEPVV